MERGAKMESKRSSKVWVPLLAMVAIGTIAGNAVSADRTVLVEYFNSTG
jgi:hypothetical protein